MLDRLDETGASWRVVGLLAVALFIASLLPIPFRRRPEFGRVGPDKFLHLVGHSGFAAALAAALNAGRFDHRTAGVLAISGSTGYGLIIGRLQEWVPGRVHESADIVAGFIGSVLGVLGWAYLTADTSALRR